MNRRESPLAVSTAFTIFTFILLCATSSAAQSFTVIYNFGGPPDGANPVAGVTFDTHGNLYGTTQRGGLLDCLLDGCGTVFQLTPSSGGNWTERVLSLLGGSTGTPSAPVVLDRLGNVYGTLVCTEDCFSGNGGSLFEVVHGSNGSWTTWDLADYWSDFGGGLCEGCGIAFDQVGKLYGLSASNHQYQGAVFYLGQLSVRNWYTIILYSFHGGSDGSVPSVWLTFGANHSIFSTTNSGGAGNAGTVFMVQNAGGAQWTETQLYAFLGGSDGATPYGGVVFDSAGNLYGTTSGGGSANKGTVFKLTHNSNGTWSESVLYSFQGGSDAVHPAGPLVFDATGNLYGVASGGSYGHGAVFKLVPSGSGWTESVLYSFTGGLDGDTPSGGLVLDSSGSLYGTTVHGGAFATCSDEPYCGGVVYKITP